MVIRFYSDRFFHPTDNTEDFQCTMIACTDLQNIRAQRLVNIHGIRSLDLQKFFPSWFAQVCRL